MRILLINRAKVPVFAYGGIERVIWYLARALANMGHEITFLVPEGSHCDFAKALVLNKDAPLKPQIPKGFDIVHFQSLPDFNPDVDFDQPYIMTEHGNANKPPTTRYLNIVFISADHAKRHNSTAFVYNGLDWDDYGRVDFDLERSHFHFLGKASWPAKNVQGAIDVARDAGVTLAVLGGQPAQFQPRLPVHTMAFDPFPWHGRRPAEVQPPQPIAGHDLSCALVRAIRAGNH